MNTKLFKRHIPLLAFILLSALVTKAQSASLGVKAGLINSKFVTSSESTGRNAFYLGIVTNFKILKKISRIYSIQGEINYCPEGSKINGLQPIPDFMYSQLNLSSNTVYYGSYKNETILNNMKIPVLAKVTLPISTHFKYYILLGPYLSYLGKAETETSGTSSIFQVMNVQTKETFETPYTAVSFNNEWDATNEYRKFNLGAEGGIGFSYGHPCRPTRIFIEGRFGMNISNIYKGESLRTDKNQTFKTIAAGLLFAL